MIREARSTPPGSWLRPYPEYELIPTLGALSPRGGPVQDPVLTPPSARSRRGFTGVSCSEENAPLYGPTVGLCLGPCGGPRGWVFSYERGTLVHFLLQIMTRTALTRRVKGSWFVVSGFGFRVSELPGGQIPLRSRSRFQIPAFGTRSREIVAP